MNERWVQYLMDKYGVAWFKCDEESGNIIDGKGSHIGTPYNLTYQGEEGIYFNGNNSYIQFNDKVIPIGKKSIYFEFKADSKLDRDMAILCVGLYSDGTINGIRGVGDYIFINEKGCIGWINYSGNIFASDRRININYLDIDYCDGQWHKVLLTWDGTTNGNGVKIYVDDLKTPIYSGASLSEETSIQAMNLVIGKTGHFNEKYTACFKGNLRNVQIYNEVIDPIPKFYLLKAEDKYYTYLDNQFIEVELAIENFENYGIIDLSTLLTPNEQGIKPISRLKDPEIICLTDKHNPQLYIKGFRDLRPLMESNNPKILINSEVGHEIKVTYHPKAQLILPVGDIVLRMLERIHNFTVYTNKNHGGDIKIIFSIDSGRTWLIYNGKETEKVDINNLEEIEEKGLTPDEFNAIGEKWNDIIVDDKIRFAYYLEIESINDIAEVDRLETEMDMHGRWRKAEHLEDYDYEYDNEHIYITFYKNGSYKVNYQG